jgi:hypothetical protein
LTVTENTYVGYSGWGYFMQGVAWTGPNTQIITGGGTFETNNLYLGYNSESGGNYILANGNLTVTENTYVGYSGWGNFSQGGVWNNNTFTLTPGGTFQTGNLYLGYNPGSGGNYILANGKLTVTGNTYVGYSGQGYFNQTGGMHQVNGTLAISVNPGTSTGTYEMSGGTLNAGNIINKGTFNFTGGEVITRLLSNYGLFKGGGASFTGTVMNYGTVSPGSSPGTLNISGDYTQDALGKLLIELAGYTQGTEYDFLNITGKATLAGTLDVQLWGGFVPKIGDTFDILHAGSGVSGTFDFINWPTGYWIIEYGQFDVSLKVVPVPSTLLLLGSGLIGIAGIMRRKFKR